MSNTAEYVVIQAFRDKFTREHYAVGDTYTSDNADRVAFLQEEGYLAQEAVEPDDDDSSDDERLTALGRGYYQLPNGDKVRGKKAAFAKLQELDQE